MRQQSFEKLREHLDLVRPIFKDFCLLSGYQTVNPTSIGRYPRIRVEKPGAINRWLDLWMELDENGNRFEHFFETIPYELSAGAYFDVKDDTKYGHRYQKSFVIFSGKHFNTVPETLLEDLLATALELKDWTIEMLKTEGMKVQLG
jgi:hypothetical protein